jgi:hypothetical protein
MDATITILRRTALTMVVNGLGGLPVKTLLVIIVVRQLTRILLVILDQKTAVGITTQM